MKRALLFVFFACMGHASWAQDFVAVGDSCFQSKNYRLAAKNYDLFLEKVESRSNQIAYRSAESWALAGDTIRSLAAVRKYVDNNYINEYYTFSSKLILNKSFDLLKDKQEWKVIIAKVLDREKAYKMQEKIKLDSIVRYQAQLDQKGTMNRLDFSHGQVPMIYKRLVNYNQYPKIKDQLISFQFKFNDTLHTSFLVVLPKDYNEKKKYPLLFFLHGAVKTNTSYYDYSDASDTAGWNRYYTKYASLHQLIMVYPNGNRAYNWMSPDKGFYMIPAILVQIKNIVNIDDDRVFVSGHSNGATGSFSYAMKQPSAFAGFYGFNTRPQVATGGTFIRNLLNRSFFNVSTDQDYYYPPAANDSLRRMMQNIHADYQDHRYNGFPHWFPAFPESEPAYRLLFADLIKRKRQPFKSFIQWECDDVKYGRCDWLEISALDTFSHNASWHSNLNFDINKWLVLDKKDQAISRDTTLRAFKYEKKSAAVRAHYKENVFNLETSNVAGVKIYLSPEMVDFSKPVQILVNGKLRYKGKVKYNKAFMLKEFSNTLDRRAVWGNYVDIKI